jgi:hypothetical protein
MDPFSPIAAIQSTLSVVEGLLGQALTSIFSAITSSTFIQIIAMIVILGKCIFLGINFFIQSIMWFFSKFIPWLFGPWPKQVFSKPKASDVSVRAGFIPWMIRYIICMAYSIASFSKCFLWYALDTAGWIAYLPFRFVFWLCDYMLNVGLLKVEKDMWYFLAEVDYFLHGPANNYFLDTNYVPGPQTTTDPNSLNLGMHIIHFPDSVMEQCYAFRPFKLANLASFPMKAFQQFLSCAMNPF